jgi:hypothetical protein
VLCIGTCCFCITGCGVARTSNTAQGMSCCFVSRAPSRATGITAMIAETRALPWRSELQDAQSTRWLPKYTAKYLDQARAGSAGPLAQALPTSTSFELCVPNLMRRPPHLGTLAGGPMHPAGLPAGLS